MSGDCVQEVTVMAYYEYGVLIVAEVILEPLYSFQVEVIGRLVQQQVVRLSEKSLCEHDPHLLFTRKLLHIELVLLDGDTELLKQAASVSLAVVTAHLGKLLFVFGHFDAILFGEVRFAVKLIALFTDIPKFLVTHQHRVEHLIFIIFEVVLA